MGISRNHSDFRADFLVETCPICGKEFHPAPLHAYKDPTEKKLICTYSCYLRAMRLHHARLRAQKRPLHIESINDEKWALVTISGVVVDVYYSIDEAQDALDAYNLKNNKKQ